MRKRTDCAPSVSGRLSPNCRFHGAPKPVALLGAGRIAKINAVGLGHPRTVA